jgi:hypothetical protein
LNPAKLHREIQLLWNRLYDLVENKDEASVPPARRHGPSLELNRARKRRLSAAAD